MNKEAQIANSSEKKGIASEMIHERRMTKVTTASQEIQPLRVLMKRVIEFL
jgi:hypothetical protein